MGSNFEQYIKDAMDNPPEFPFDENLWNDMEARLDAQKDQKTPFGFIGKLPLFLWAATMTGLCIYFYANQNNNSNPPSSPELEEKKEISVERHVTVIYDTIYNKIVVNQQNIQPSTQSNNKAPVYSTGYSSAQFALLLDEKELFEIFESRPLSAMTIAANQNFPSIGLSRESEPAAAEALTSSEKTSIQKEFDLTDFAFVTMPISQIPTLEQKPFMVSNPVDLPAIKVKKMRKKKVRLYLQQLKPTRFALSGTTGTFASLNLGGSGFNLRGSAHAEIGIGTRLSLIAGVEYFANDFTRRFKEDDEYPVMGFPDLPPSSGEDILLKIQGDFNYLQIPFGIKYALFPRKYFNPYIGAGLISGRTNRSRLEYEYQSIQGSYSVSEGRLLSRNFELSAFWSSLGFQIRMNQHWSLILEGSSQFALHKGTFKYENLQLLKLSTGVHYQF